MEKVSCIIAAYNERDRIGKVLDAVSGHPLVNEIIVVDDGSVDGTQDIVANFPDVKLIVQPKNGGKTSAVVTGLKQSSGELVMLIDADLIGLTKENITNLINPILENRADITISLRGNTPGAWKLIGLDYISGERVFHKKIFDGQYENLAKLRGFGLETFMNKIIVKNNLRIKVVPWPKVESPYPYDKRDFWPGIKAFIGMFVDIFKTSSPFRIIYTIAKMIKLKTK
jgi:glycosyltransferase involved in cell wall biosynthesis